MASYNQDRFYYNKYDVAVQSFGADDKTTADEACAELINDVECPRFVQIQAFQLRSMCTINYWWAKTMLDRALVICEELVDDEHRAVQAFRSHTQAMIGELEDIWKKRWAAEGRDPPEEEVMEDTYLVGDEAMEAKADAETLAKEYEALNLMAEDLTRGGSPAIADRPGGWKAPWLKPGPGTIITDTPLPPSPPPPTPGRPRPESPMDDAEGGSAYVRPSVEEDVDMSGLTDSEL